MFLRSFLRYLKTEKLKYHNFTVFQNFPLLSQPKRFAIIGAAGYVAPRHMAAIIELGHELVATYDIHDSVGILDRYAPSASFFTEYERFERHLNKLALNGVGIDYLVICSPNYLHDSHTRLGLRLKADVICEKPVALNERNILSLIEAEKQSENNVWCILQARLHPEIVRLRQNLSKSDLERRHVIDIEYVTPRGQWYDYSWKGDVSKSGGIETNIGIHLFDLVNWLFGPFERATCIKADARSYEGKLVLAKADVDFKLSVKSDDLPRKQTTAFRRFRVNGEVYDLSSNFETLHVNSYKTILAKNGFKLQDARPAVAIVEKLRSLRNKPEN